MRPSLLLLVLAAPLAASCGSGSERRIVGVSGDPDRGLELMAMWGCGACHRIPKIPLARGEVGPPLADVARRAYIAGVLPNTPENMVRWIVSPQAIDPRTAMPDLGVPDAAARDMTAYLYSLR